MDRFIKVPSLTNPNRIRGTIFDVAILAGNIFFVGSFLESGENLPDRTIGILLMAAIVTQLLGAVLKTGPLRYRLSQKPSRQNTDLLDKFTEILIFFHFLLFTIISMMTLELLGVYEAAGDDTGYMDDVWIVISLMIGLLLAYIVWRAGKRPEKEPTTPGKYPNISETVADISLWISVSIITRFFWESWYTEIEPSRGIGLSVLGIVLLVALSFLYVVFYLPSRYLYLVEDYRYGRTWVRMWIAMLPLAWLILVG